MTMVTVYDITPEYDIHILACLDTVTNAELVAIHRAEGHTIVEHGSEACDKLSKAQAKQCEAIRLMESARTWALLGTLSEGGQEGNTNAI